MVTAVNADCRNASNPYHECVEYCSRVIAAVQASKKTEEKEVVQVNPDCRNASSVEYFSGRISEVKASKKTEEKEVAQVKDGKTLSTDSSCASVGAYRVRQDIASTLRLIFDKHGDIAANSRLKSTSMRAFYLESLCSVVQELQSTDFKRLAKSKLKEMLAVLSDVESAQIDVSWLLNELGDTEEALEEHDAAEFEKSECDDAIESTRKELESLTKVLAQQEKAAADARARVTKARAQVTEASRRVKDRVRESLHVNHLIDSKGIPFETC